MTLPDLRIFYDFTRKKSLFYDFIGWAKKFFFRMSFPDFYLTFSDFYLTLPFTQNNLTIKLIIKSKLIKIKIISKMI